MDEIKIVFLHGLGQNAEVWTETLSCIGKQDFLCIDLLDSEENCFTYPCLMERLESVVSKNDAELIIVGISLGAVMAIDYYLRHRDKVKALILVAPQYKMPKLMLGIQNGIFRLLPESQFAKAGVSKEKMISISASMKELDFSRQLNLITCPVYIVCGEKDFANKRAAHCLHEKLIASELTIINGVGHEVNVDAPEKLAEIITKTYDNVS